MEAGVSRCRPLLISCGVLCRLARLRLAQSLRSPLCHSADSGRPPIAGTSTQHSPPRRVARASPPVVSRAALSSADECRSTRRPRGCRFDRSACLLPHADTVGRTTSTRHVHCCCDAHTGDALVVPLDGGGGVSYQSPSVLFRFARVGSRPQRLALARPTAAGDARAHERSRPGCRRSRTNRRRTIKLTVGSKRRRSSELIECVPAEQRGAEACPFAGGCLASRLHPDSSPASFSRQRHVWAASQWQCSDCCCHRWRALLQRTSAGRRVSEWPGRCHVRVLETRPGASVRHGGHTSGTDAADQRQPSDGYEASRRHACGGAE